MELINAMVPSRPWTTLAFAVGAVCVLAGCGKVEAPSSSVAPPPPSPAPRRLQVKLVMRSLQLDPEQQAAADPGKKTAAPMPPLDAQVSESNGKTPLELSGPAQHSNRFHWSGYRGQAVIVVFWSLDCPDLKETMASLENILDFYRHRPLAIVGVNVDEDSNAARDFVERERLTFETIYDGEQGGAIQKKYPLTALPMAVAATKQGNLINIDLNAPNLSDQLETLLREEYTGPPPEPNRYNVQSRLARPGIAARAQAAEKPKKTGKYSQAKTGAGKKGRGYGGGVYSEPLRAFQVTKDRLVFDVQLPKAMQLYQAEHDGLPATHEEFMRDIVEANSITLPELPAGQEYVYVPEQGKLLIYEEK